MSLRPSGDATWFVARSATIIGFREQSWLLPIFDRQFKGFFCISLRAVIRVWLNIRGGPNPTEREHLLWGLHMLQAYPTEQVGCRVFFVSEKTYRKWTWIVISRIVEFPYVGLQYSIKFCS